MTTVRQRCSLWFLFRTKEEMNEMAENGRAVEPKEKPTLDPTDVAQLPESTNCLTCSEDGRFLGLGHSQGLSVWSASNFTCVAEWLQPQLEITFVQMTRVAENTYLLGTVDDMGVSRVFGLCFVVIHLLSTINIMEDINIRSIFRTFEFHEDGEYGAASVSCKLLVFIMFTNSVISLHLNAKSDIFADSDAVWLEVYQFPIEAWQRELQMEPAQPKDESFSEGSDVKWSPVTLILKISPPTVPTENMCDFLTQCLALDMIRGSGHQKEQSSFCSEDGKTKKACKSPSCTHHFLLPCDKLTSGSEAGTGLPVAVAVWWSGSCNLLQYSLQNVPKDKPDVTPMPEMLLPNAKDILCSAVSRCTCYIALGFEDALVSIWDRRSGAPLSILVVPEETSPITRVQFLKNCSVAAQDCQIVAADPVSLLLLCKNGAFYTVTTGPGIHSCTKQLIERLKDSRGLPTVTTIVPFLQGVSLVVQRSGKMSLKDVINRDTVCNLTLPTSFQIASPYSPVYVLNVKQQALFIRGDPQTSSSDLSQRGNQSQLFVFRFNQSDIVKPLIVSHQDPPRQQTLEEICNLYLEQRSHSADERNKALAQTWGKLQETAAAMEQQRSEEFHPLSY
ncbi:WD repeat-containing protein 93 [Cyprinodon tularosa]|uniref:WD repeat-containing protein 93 n=1 Tax=Cyprinodon tularosa TaxID=77115 RepID=UPI0018E27717|nr:WD repeat-containing protein 93 [Cyprinodon tularosa]